MLNESNLQFYFMEKSNWTARLIIIKKLWIRDNEFFFLFEKELAIMVKGKNQNYQLDPQKVLSIWLQSK